jgi:hypothetical protein
MQYRVSGTIEFFTPLSEEINTHVMFDALQEFHPVIQALLATLFTWGVTALGAALVFFVKTVKPRVMDSMLGFAAGVMIAASFWSLLAPGIEMAEQLGNIPWLTALIGFMGGVSSCDSPINFCHTFIPAEKDIRRRG